jgi:vacuolar-type H+-ATPase subunit H
LKDLAAREAALTQKVEAAKTEAQRIVADAHTRAAQALSKAQQDASALEAEFKARRETETKSIADSASSSARAAAESAKAVAQGRINDAVKLIVARVLP